MTTHTKFTKCLLLVLVLLFPLVLLAAGSIGSLALATPGSGWELRATFSNVVFSAIAPVDELTAWAAASYGGGIYKTIDGGTTWMPQLTGMAIPSISAVNASTAYAVGGSTVYRTTDGGITWAPIYSNPSVSAGWIQALDASNVLVCGQAKTAGDTYGRGFVAKTSDAGASWQVLYLASIQSEIINLSAPSPSVIWAGVTSLESSTQNFIIKTADGGGNWTSVTSIVPGPLGTGFAISATDANTAWTERNGTGSTEVWKTTDGGANWVQKYSYNQWAQCLFTSVDANVTWVTFMSGPALSTLIKTEDGGTTWTTQMTTTGHFLTGVGAVNRYVAWVGGGYINLSTDPITFGCEVYRTTTGGGPAPPVPTVTSVTPTEAGQFAFSVSLQVTGTGFLPGANLRLEYSGSVMGALSMSVDSDKQITASVFLFGASPGAYDIVVTNPDGGEGKLPAGFSVTSACGSGSGSAVLMLGLALGLLSLAGSTTIRKRRQRR